MSSFIIFRRPDGHYGFNLMASNGQIILTGEGYSTKEEVLDAVESARKNGKKPGQFTVSEPSTGKYTFSLYTSNGQDLGESQVYATKTGAETGIKAVMQNIATATVQDETFTYNTAAVNFPSTADFIRKRRRQLGLTQVELAQKAGVGLRFIRELEGGEKETLRIDKVNQVLILFGHRLAPVPIK
jgi:uncharacterized protein